MAGKSLNASRNFLATTLAQPKPVRRGTGTLVFAGNHWPPQATNSGKYHDARVAITEARKIISRAYLAASAACRGEEKYRPVMERWFGVRPVGAKGTNEDWWEGARHIIGVLEGFLTSNLNIYYRGDNSLIGRPTDYPGENGNLTAHDVSGYAESSTGTRDCNIGLCKVFFQKQAPGKGSSLKLHGFNSAGGVLVHELSHNLCSTEDHDFNGNSCYGENACQQMALSNSRRHRAWWNADNIEFFCEDVGYAVQAKAPVATGATNSVAALRAQFTNP